MARPGACALVAVLFSLFVGVVAVHAQAGPGSIDGSYITPFPGSERYRLRVIGDEFGEGVHGALVEALGSDPRLDIEKKAVWLSGLTRPNSTDELGDIASGAKSDKPNIAVIMFGSMDRWSYRAPNGQRYVVGSSEWRKVYIERIDALIRDLKAAGAAIYWVGLPMMRRGKSTRRRPYRTKCSESGLILAVCASSTSTRALPTRLATIVLMVPT